MEDHLKPDNAKSDQLRTIYRRKCLSVVLVVLFACVGVQQWISGAPHREELARLKLARHICDRAAEEIQKYNCLEGYMPEKLMDLKGKYLTSIDTLKDPWGNNIQMDRLSGYVYSKGPDGRDNKTNYLDPSNSDNIRVPFIGALCITKATILINPEKETNLAWARDLLHLQFNKPCKLNGEGFVLNDASVGSSESFLTPSQVQMAGKSIDPAAEKYFFRWCKGDPTKYIDGSTILRQPSANFVPGEGNPDRQWIRNHGPVFYFFTEHVLTWDVLSPYFSQVGRKPEILEGGLYPSEDLMEVLIVLPAGTSGSIIPGQHYINLTGNRKNQSGGSGQLFCEVDGVTPAEMSRTPIMVELF